MFHRQTIYEQITNPRSGSAVQRWLPYLLSVALPAGFLAFFRYLCRQEGFADWLITHVTSPVKQALGRLWSHVPFAMAEVMWAAAVIGLLLFLLHTLFAVGKALVLRARGEQTHPLSLLLRRGLVLLSALLIIYCGYSIGWGVNYYGQSFSEMSGLEGRETTSEELADLTELFVRRCNELSVQVDRDENGIFTVRGEDLFLRSEGLYQTLSQRFPCLDQPEVQAKPMAFSRIMSWLGFTGFYFPFTGESMVNTDSPDCLIPATILHELAHQKNIALENECNFLAIVAGLESEDPEFQYSSALMGYIHLGNALFSADRTLWREVRAQLNEHVLADLEDHSRYWDQFETPVAEAAETVYTGFAESYETYDIMRSYGACVDLLAAYYLPTLSE
ncbi:MAG: DUF3810 domain-containing protein [Oscillospiraceae bacterium]|nr:DUF3810 domain-containing protein [Oscillospiraceae bacterium]